jgi:hypothetical protein
MSVPPLFTHMAPPQLTHVETAAETAQTAASTWVVAAAALTVLVLGFALFAFACFRGSRGGADEDGDSGWGGGGGSGPSGPHGPMKPDNDPAWWPEFEQQFAAWVQQTGRAEPLLASSRTGGGSRCSARTE